MITAEQRKADICKVIKAFLLFRPESTSNEILSWLSEHKFGFNKELTPHKLSSLMLAMNGQANNTWFCVEMLRVPGKPVRWRIIE